MTGDNQRANAQAELAKAHAARRAAQALAEMKLYDDAASRLYYAAFHLVSASLLTLGVQAQTHGGLMSLLGQHLVQPGLVPAAVARHFAALMGLRSQADYNRHFTMDAEGFVEEMQKADELFSSLEAFVAERGI
jgi:uncharacterized protein (UPF0332 family)